MARLSAAMAFFAALSLAPLLLLLISFGGWLMGAEPAQRQLRVLTTSFSGPRGAEAVASLLDHASEGSAYQAWAAVLGIGSLFIGASGMFRNLRDALNVIWRVPRSPTSGWRFLLRNQVTAVSLVFVAGALFILSAGLMIVFAQARHDAPTVIAEAARLWEFLSLLAFFGFLTLLLSLVFRLLPDAPVRWRDAGAGGVTTALLFSAGQWSLATYLGQAHLASRYGAAGTLTIVLIWIYLWTSVLLMGAAFTEALSSGDPRVGQSQRSEVP